MLGIKLICSHYGLTVIVSAFGFCLSCCNTIAVIQVQHIFPFSLILAHSSYVFVYPKCVVYMATSDCFILMPDQCFFYSAHLSDLPTRAIPMTFPPPGHSYHILNSSSMPAPNWVMWIGPPVTQMETCRSKQKAKLCELGNKMLQLRFYWVWQEKYCNSVF